MDKQKVLNEFIWLIGIGAIAALLEYAIIVLLDLHPILSIKIQAFIGLVIVAYIIRMLSRVWKSSDDKIGSEVNRNGK